MRFKWRLLILSVLSFWGCDNPPQNSTPPAGAPPRQTNVPQPTFHLNNQQPKLPTLTLYIGPKQITAELATTVTQIATGMMFRKQMGTNEGMLFVFRQPQRASFYMKNTTVPLSAAYIDPDGVIHEIVDLKPLDETPVLASSDNIQYVLEVNQGWFKENGIGAGTVITTDKGTLREAFFGR